MERKINRYEERESVREKKMENEIDKTTGTATQTEGRGIIRQTKFAEDV